MLIRNRLTGIIAILILMFTSAIAVSADQSNDVNGQFFLQGTFCAESPVGFCGQGVSTGDIAGDVNIVLTGLTLNAGNVFDPFNPSTPLDVDYTATITISSNGGTLNGTMTANNLSVFNADGSFNRIDNTATITFTDGTGIYNRTTGTLNVTGIIDASDFETDSYSGTLTAPHNGARGGANRP